MKGGDTPLRGVSTSVSIHARTVVPFPNVLVASSGKRVISPDSNTIWASDAGGGKGCQLLRFQQTVVDGYGYRLQRCWPDIDGSLGRTKCALICPFVVGPRGQ